MTRKLISMAFNLTDELATDLLAACLAAKRLWYDRLMNVDESDEYTEEECEDAIERYTKARTQLLEGTKDLF